MPLATATTGNRLALGAIAILTAAASVNEDFVAVAIVTHSGVALRASHHILAVGADQCVTVVTIKHGTATVALGRVARLAVLHFTPKAAAGVAVVAFTDFSATVSTGKACATSHRRSFAAVQIAGAAPALSSRSRYETMAELVRLGERDNVRSVQELDDQMKRRGGEAFHDARS
jgi:hypothetical protein